uniref:Uncharacterized protein n=1 Tax=Ditylenchus dipsaci TaxID=166011 RepID=A0A915EH91_9BILA
MIDQFRKLLTRCSTKGLKLCIEFCIGSEHLITDEALKKVSDPNRTMTKYTDWELGTLSTTWNDEFSMSFVALNLHWNPVAALPLELHCPCLECTGVPTANINVQ